MPSTSTTDSSDDLKNPYPVNSGIPTPMTDKEFAITEKFKTYFTTDIDVITRTIQTDRQYKDEIDPQVILRVNEHARSMKWSDYQYYMTYLEDDEQTMAMMYQNIFYKNSKVHRILKKGLSNLTEDESLFVAKRFMNLLRMDIKNDGTLFVGEDLIR
jgi:hypothetical protein